MTKQEIYEANIQIPQAITYLVETSTKLLEHIMTIENERDIYKAKYDNEVDLKKRLIDDKAI